MNAFSAMWPHLEENANRPDLRPWGLKAEAVTLLPAMARQMPDDDPVGGAVAREGARWAATQVRQAAPLSGSHHFCSSR